MMGRTVVHRFTPAICAVALGALAACDASQKSPTSVDDASQVSALIASTNINTGSDAGDFVNAIAPTNAGRAFGAFWDNTSADLNPVGGVEACNIGYYALGTMSGTCINAAPGSAANQGGGYTKYFGDGAGRRDPSSFTFDGTRSHTVTLVGSYAGGQSTVGWFTKSGGVYTFTAVPAWSTRSINTTITIDPSMTGGKDWGFYIKNNSNPSTGGCAPPDTDCSDAEGGFTAAQFQQFALFADAAETKMLVGAEDNRLELLPNGTYEDSDYNDYIWSVVPERVGGQGCSPGYWKNHNAWPAPYTKNTLFSDVFENAFPGKTLQQVISTGGGGLNALGRQTVSALLNAASPGVSFELSPTTVISRFNAAFPGTNAQYDVLKNSFEALTDVNGRICPLN
jgi:hypothetical protein